MYTDYSTEFTMLHNVIQGCATQAECQAAWDSYLNRNNIEAPIFETKIKNEAQNFEFYTGVRF